MMKNRIVVVHLYGGIGNQLFQYTFGEFLRKKYKLNVYYDISSFGVLATFRDLQIKSIVNEIPIYDTNKYFFSRHTKFYRRISRWFFKHRKGVKYFEDKIDENIFTQDKWHLIYFDGYWQNSYFPKWIQQNIGNIYKPLGDVPKCLNKYISYTQCNNVVSIHIRRGDYLNAINVKRFGVCTLEYYQKAIEMIKDKVKEPFFLFFSDDIEWVKENFKLGNIMDIVENDNISPFWYIYLMSLCSHNVLSNSTFSWWGNFLNENRQKITIAPARWFLDKDNPNLYFENWDLI